VLTAVDAAIMVVDAAKGVEEQTIKLLEVCRLRDTPIITFINKMDREVREPLELLDEIESILKIHCAPVTWPIGMGKRFQGVYHCSTRDPALQGRRGKRRPALRIAAGPGEAALKERFRWKPTPCCRNRTGARRRCDLPPRRLPQGRQTPCVLRLRINNFGVREVLRALADWRRRRSRARRSSVRSIRTEPKFTGFVFKIQANMDPQHRDRIAFFRVCSGRYSPNMKVRTAARPKT